MYGGVEVRVHAFLNSTLDWRDGQLSRKYPLDRRLGGPKSQYGLSGDDQSLMPLLGIAPRLLCLTHRQVAIFYVILSSAVMVL
jgi:hypothetical protein